MPPAPLLYLRYLCLMHLYLRYLCLLHLNLLNLFSCTLTSWIFISCINQGFFISCTPPACPFNAWIFPHIYSIYLLHLCLLYILTSCAFTLGPFASCIFTPTMCTPSIPLPLVPWLPEILPPGITFASCIFTSCNFTSWSLCIVTFAFCTFPSYTFTSWSLYFVTFVSCTLTSTSYVPRAMRQSLEAVSPEPYVHCTVHTVSCSSISCNSIVPVPVLTIWHRFKTKKIDTYHIIANYCFENTVFFINYSKNILL